jgi:hypothetical protein
MLNSFHQKGYINKDNYINLFDKYFAFQRLEGEFTKYGFLKKDIFLCSYWDFGTPNDRLSF